ncbi:MAG: NAD+ synthase, partial [Phycisphaerae bacterium]|nr:NAD+ synthase [Phycisphaerae bacterium]
MRLALAQVNPTIGAIEANAGLILRHARTAVEGGADLVVFPELALTGYPPRDLLLQGGFVGACERALEGIARELPAGLMVVVGVPLPERAGSRRLVNALVVLRGGGGRDGGEVLRYAKRLLPTYDVFDEDRYFVPGSKPAIVEVKGVRVGLSVCEDLWRGEDVGFADRYLTCPDPLDELCAPPGGGAGAQVIVNPSASPFVLGKGRRHAELLRGHAVKRGVWVAAVNQVGGNDELVFEGGACVFDPSGSLRARGPSFEEGLTFAEIEPGGGTRAAGVPGVEESESEEVEAQVFGALRLGIRDYCRKTGFKSAVLGLSGGIDSALTAVLAAAALGPGNVVGIAMPSRYSSAGSLTDAAELARSLGVRFETISIEGPFRALEASLEPMFRGTAPGVAEENMQSRVRGTLLMAASNKFGHILLTTGNKSELAVGYCTLYGDMNGGLAVLSDVTKVMVYRLSRWVNANWSRLGIAGLSGPPIPEASITKPPSAELRPDQKDQDTLPAYEVLDEIIERYVERRQDSATILRESGFGAAVVAKTIRMIDLAEYKRKQAPIGLKVTGVAFGSGRR